MLEDLAKLRLHFPAISRLQTTRSFEENMAALDRYARKGAKVVLLWYRGKLTGSAVLVPLQGRGPVAADYVYSMVYVHPEFRGGGLSNDLFEALKTANGSIIAFGYETDEILSYAKARHDHEDTGVKDDQGNPVFRLVRA